MYISPNTTVKLLKDVPLDASEDHTIWFDTVADQTAWFSAFVKSGMTFDRQYYQRHSKNEIKLEVLADNVYDCNYMMFQNTSYGAKWFYAYITNVEYVNNNVTIIQYQIDDLQTWHFDFTLGQCFVEREHQDTDVAGDNLVPENLETGEYVKEMIKNAEDLESLSIVLFATVASDYSDFYGTMREGVFSGLCPIVFPLTDAGAQQAVSWIQNLPITKRDAVQMAWIMPTYFADVNIVAGGEEITKNHILYRDNQGTVQVKNNKLLTYPYNYLYVSNNQGKSAVFPYEYFSSPKCMFDIFGDFTPNPTVLMYPLNFKGSTQNYDEALSISGFPQIAYNLDSFKAWVAQAASSLGLTAIGAMATEMSLPMAGMATTFSGLQEVAGLGTLASSGSMVKLAVEGVIHSAMPPQARGSQASAVKIPAGLMNFTFYNVHLRPEFAAILDDYFTMFGYACHRVKVPNRHVRLKFTYTKTVNCVLNKSEMPADAARHICDIFNRGITYWDKTATVGDYTQTNTPIQ